MLRFASCVAAFLFLASTLPAAEGLIEGKPGIKSIGPLAFGPDGVLFLGDPFEAAVFAVQTEDVESEGKLPQTVEGVKEKIAGLLGTTADDIFINDLAVNPASGHVFLSVSRGRGLAAKPVLIRMAAGKISEFSLDQVKFAKAKLPNAPDLKFSFDKRRNQRLESITDLAYVDGRVIVAGLSNEEFASKLRVIPYPFTGDEGGASVEIFHGSHGRFETHSPVRTFVSYNITGEPNILAAYTCTPLVKFPISQLTPGTKVRGTTVAELGNQNRPLDMIVYHKGGKDFLLLANSMRGVMKIKTENLDRAEGITEKVEDTAGQEFETIEGLSGVTQLDRLNDTQAVVLVEDEESGRADLRTIELP